MKNYDSRTYNINDFLEWYQNNQLELNPKFQRRSVWNDNARSFLMDTIIRGFPIPKVFIRQKINVLTRKSVREVVDGQQRLRTILSFLNDGFTISKKHNSQYGGLYFSQLNDVDPDIQSAILGYEISCDLLVNMPDPQVLDVFSRLNSYSVVLNEQEKINANHFSPFKLLVDSVSKDFFQFWIENDIISEQKCLRMDDVSLTADLFIAMVEGIKEKKKIKFFYDKYENEFDFENEELRGKFNCIMSLIATIFPDGLKTTEFKRVHLFYSLFTALYHIQYGISNLDLVDFVIDPENETHLARISRALDKVEEIYQKEEGAKNLTKEEIEFISSCHKATTDASRRLVRTNFIVKLIIQYIEL